jgi:hypothetical protein
MTRARLRQFPALVLMALLPAMAACLPEPRLVEVPAGRFQMGSSGSETVDQGADARRVSNERPVHEVVIAQGFRLGPHRWRLRQSRTARWLVEVPGTHRALRDPRTREG